jgi:hypothetical protein
MIIFLIFVYISDLAPNYSGFVGRNMRLIAAAADMMKPYIKINSVDNSTINYTLHGCGHVERVKFYMIPDNENNKTLNEKYMFANKTEQFCIWGKYAANDTNWDTITFQPKENHTIYILLDEVDDAFSSQNKPKPEVKSQGHLTRIRSMPNYSIMNDNYILKGNDKFRSNPIININGTFTEVDDYNAYILNSSMINLVDINSTKEFETCVKVTRNDCNCKTSNWLFDLSVKFIYNPNKADIDNTELTIIDNTEYTLYNKDLNCEEINSIKGECDILTSNNLLYR